MPTWCMATTSVIVPLNSSHYCWGTEPLPAGVVESFLTVPERGDHRGDGGAAAVRRRSSLERSDDRRRGAWPGCAWARFCVPGPMTNAFASGCFTTSCFRQWARGIPRASSPYEPRRGAGVPGPCLSTQVVLRGHARERFQNWDHTAEIPESLSACSRVGRSSAPHRSSTSGGQARAARGDRLQRRARRGRDRHPRRANSGGDPAPSSAKRAAVDGPMEAAVTESRCAGPHHQIVRQACKSHLRPGRVGVLHYLVCEIADPGVSTRRHRDSPPDGSMTRHG